MPVAILLSRHLKATIPGTFIMLATYTLYLYYDGLHHVLWHNTPLPDGLGFSRNTFLWMLMVAVTGFGVMVPVAGMLAERFRRRRTMLTVTLLIIAFAFLFPGMLGSGNASLVMAFLLLGLSLMGLTFGPMGALLPELFPIEVRYTGASFPYNLSSILGASVAPYIATWLTYTYGLYLASIAL